MAWCPVCNSEYVEGKTECRECKVALVDSLEQTEKDGLFIDYSCAIDAMVEMEASTTERAISFLEKSEPKDVDDVVESELPSENTQNFIMKRELDEAIRKAREPVAIYQKKSEQADNHKSSASTLIIIGVLGAIMVVLFAFDLIPFLIGYSNKTLVVGVMGSIFLFLILMGFSSVKAFQKLVKESDIENNLEKDIKEWCKLNITLDFIESMITDKDLFEEEEIYFQRMDEIKKSISTKFMNLEEGFLDKLADDCYIEIFES